MADVIEIDAEVTETETLSVEMDSNVGGGSGVAGYAYLPDKPQINGVTLIGNKTTEDLHITQGVQDVLIDDVSIVGSNYEAHIPIADQQTTGLIPATSMDKLFHIENGAQKNVQADWNQTFSSFDDYIKNKPNLATVAESGSYNDLLNKPKMSDIQNDAGYVSHLSQLGCAYLEAVDDFDGTASEGTSYTASMPSSQQYPYYLDNGSMIAVKFPTNAVRHPVEGGSYVAPKIRIYTKLNPPDAYTSYISIYFKGEMIPSNQIKADDIALLVYDANNNCFEHIGYTTVNEFSSTQAGVVPACGVPYSDEMKILTQSGWQAIVVGTYTNLMDFFNNVLVNPTLKTINNQSLIGSGNITIANSQSDWNQSDTTADDYIKNKPTLIDASSPDPAILTITKGSSSNDVPRLDSNGKIYTGLINSFSGTDGSSAGAAGLVPAPATTDSGKFLKSDGSWATPSGGGGDAYVPPIGSVYESVNDTNPSEVFENTVWILIGTSDLDSVPLTTDGGGGIATSGGDDLVVVTKTYRFARTA